MDHNDVIVIEEKEGKKKFIKRIADLIYDVTTVIDEKQSSWRYWGDRDDLLKALCNEDVCETG